MTKRNKNQYFVINQIRIFNYELADANRSHHFLFTHHYNIHHKSKNDRIFQKQIDKKW